MATDQLTISQIKIGDKTYKIFDKETKTAATNAKTAAANAQGTANAAQTAATKAQSTADAAKTAAGTAQSTANTAKDKAIENKSTLDALSINGRKFKDNGNNITINSSNISYVNSSAEGTISKEIGLLKDGVAQRQVKNVNGNTVFKDANGNLFQLKLVEGNVALSKVTYSAPTISLVSLSWSGSSMVDGGGTGAQSANVSGSISVTNGNKPVSSVTTVTVGDKGSDGTYPISGTLSVPNNGSTTVTFTTTGTHTNPVTNSKDTPSISKTFDKKTTYSNGIAEYASEITPTSDITGGFACKMNSTKTTITNIDDTKTTRNHTMKADGYLYIFRADNKAFLINPDKGTVDGGLLAGGNVALGSIQSYSIQKNYYVTRSANKYKAGTTVYFKAL